MAMWINDIPFPPSVNLLYRSIVRGKFAVPIKTKVYREYTKELDTLMSLTKISILEKPQALYAYFYADSSHWLTQAGKAQRRDLDNLLKGILDCVLKPIGFDDKWIFEIHAFKCIGRKRVDLKFTEELTTKINKDSC